MYKRFGRKEAQKAQERSHPLIMRFSLLIAAFFLLMPIPASATQPYDAVRDSYASSDALLLDRHGEVIHELRVDPSVRKLEWVKLQDISPALRKAVIQSEDKRFYDHHWGGLEGAFVIGPGESVLE